MSAIYSLALGLWDFERINIFWKENATSWEYQPFKEIPVEYLDFRIDPIGQGAFGAVSRGYYTKPSGEIMPVAIKTISDANGNFELNDLRSEVCFLLSSFPPYFPFSPLYSFLLCIPFPPFPFPLLFPLPLCYFLSFTYSLPYCFPSPPPFPPYSLLPS